MFLSAQGCMGVESSLYNYSNVGVDQKSNRDKVEYTMIMTLI